MDELFGGVTAPPFELAAPCGASEIPSTESDGPPTRFGYRRFEEAEAILYIRELLDLLPLRDWIIWYAKDCLGMSDAEIAEALGSTPGSISSRHSRVMSRLRSEVAA